MSLDFKNTCPDIDEAIADLLSMTEDNIDEILDECCPILQGEQRKEFLKSHLANIKENIQHQFDIVRDLNSDMRGQAEKQLDDIQVEVDALEETVSEKDSAIQELENDISDLEKQL